LASLFHYIFRSSSPRRAGKRATHKRTTGCTLFLEQLEDRTVMSTGLSPQAALGFVAHPDYVLVQPAQQGTQPHGRSGSPQAGQGPGGGYAPGQLQTAYGFTSIPGLTSANYNTTAGAGQTIAIVDAYDDPNIAGDLHTFDQRFGLPDPVFTKLNQNGVAGSYPAASTDWASEIALDVEWAHAMAPAARIVLVEANSASNADLLKAVDTASVNANVVSMSWGGNEWSAESASDSHFTHPGVVYLASSGDSGSPPSWPAISPNVVSVGGTSLTLNSSNGRSSETGWGNGRSSWYYGGSGGGISSYEARPTWQPGTYYTGMMAHSGITRRMNPDVSYVADPNTGVSIYDSYGSGGWAVYGGTSIAAPQWAALTAIADQGRATPLSTGQMLKALYSHPGDFYDITSGNNGYAAGIHYDLVTGLGSPYANLVVGDLRKA